MKSQRTESQIKVDKELHKELKIAAVKEEKELREVTDDVIRAGLRARKAGRPDKAPAAV